MSAPVVPLILITLNIITFTAYGLDKAAAKRGDWRISEATLLWLAFLGGSSGAVLAQQVFRHKTRKEPFRSILLAIVLTHLALALVWLVQPQWLEAGLALLTAQTAY